MISSINKLNCTHCYKLLSQKKYLGRLANDSYLSIDENSTPINTSNKMGELIVPAVV